MPCLSIKHIGDLLSKLRYSLKDKNGQAIIEFALCAPVLLFVTLGVMDLGKASIVKLENQLILQSYVGILSGYKDAASTTNVTAAARKRIQSTSMFCRKVEGTATKACKNNVEPVETIVRLEAATPSKVTAGSEVCLAAKSSYTPFYKGLFGNGKLTVYSRSCTMMETSSEYGGWQPIKKGRW